MQTIKISRLRGAATNRKHHRCNFILKEILEKENASEQSRKHIEHLFEKIFSARLEGVGEVVSSQLLLLSSKTDASLLQSIFGSHIRDLVDIDPKILELMVKILFEMIATPYEVDIVNNTDDDVIDLTVVYFQNSLVGPKTVTSGPFSKAMSVPLPAGKSAGFSLCPCLYIVNKYAIQFKFHGNQYSITQDIPTLNAQEKADFGSIDYCGDTLEIFFQ